MKLSRTMKKSTRSGGGGNCVEVGFANDELTAVAIGDTKNPGPQLVVPTPAFAGLIERIKAGDFDL